MNLCTRLDAEDWMLLGYIIGILVWYLAESMMSDPAPAPDTHDNDDSLPKYQSLRLGEPALERLERGEPISLERWHGGDLVLHGDVVIDADKVDTDDGGRTDE